MEVTTQHAALLEEENGPEPGSQVQAIAARHLRHEVDGALTRAALQPEQLAVGALRPLRAL